MSQLVNNVLLSYMTSFIRKVQMDGIIMTRREELTQKGIINEENIAGQNFISVDYEEIYSLDIEDFLAELIEDFQNKASEFHSALICSGLKIHTENDEKPYMDKNVSINLKEISKSAGNKNWFEIVKGFLNTWEFLFLFSITESTLKNLLKNEDIYTRELIREINKKYPVVYTKLEENHNIKSTLAIEIWNIFVSVRNIYSHTHGMISEDNKKDIARRSKKFKKAYKEYTEDFLFASIFKDVDDFFLERDIKVGTFYFLADHELNVFRNFVSEYLFILSKIIKHN